MVLVLALLSFADVMACVMQKKPATLDLRDLEARILTRKEALPFQLAGGLLPVVPWIINANKDAEPNTLAHPPNVRSDRLSVC